jgi:multidrug efflux pump subunit AcrB
MLNWTGKIAKFFIENGKLTFLLVVTLFISGVFSFFLTPKKYNPTIVAPAFQIIVNYPGASKAEVIEHVTKPLENLISNISGVEDIYSVSFSGGQAILNINFYVGEDFDKAKVSLNDRIQSDIDLSPFGAQRPIIKSIDPEDVPIVTIQLSSNELSNIHLRKYAFKIKDQLTEVANTGLIRVFGGSRRELAIVVDESKLIKHAVSITQIENILKQHNFFMPIGTIKGKYEYIPLKVDARINTVKDLEEVVVLTNNTVNIKIKDLAKVKFQEVELESAITHKSTGKAFKTTVLLSIAKLKNTNISKVSDDIKNKLSTINLTGDVQATILVNDGDVARNEINNLLTNLFTSIAIVVFVLIFFLDIKSAILVAVAIPLTLSSVFVVSYYGNQSINRITLFALILSLGLLVDNATVVIENISRKLQMVKRPTPDVFVSAVNEVGPGLFMSTLTTLLAFLPMAFIGGMMGPYMGPIPFFVPAALVIALGISYTINPWMASILMKKVTQEKPSYYKNVGTKVILVYKKFIRSLLECKRNRTITLSVVVIALLLSATLPALYLVKFRMLPKANVDQFYLYVDLPSGKSLEQTQKTVKKIETILFNDKNVQMTQAYIGTPPILDFNGLFKNVNSRKGYHQATIRIGLKKKEERTEVSEEIVIKLRKKLNKSELLKNVKLKLVEDPPGPPVMSTFLIRLEGNEKLIKKITKSVMTKVKRIEGVKDLDISIPAPSHTYDLIINHEEANKTNISPALIMSTLKLLYSGKVLGVLHQNQNTEQEYIQLRFNKDIRNREKNLKNIKIFNRHKIGVSLSRLVIIKKRLSNPPLFRENDKDIVYITGEMGDRSVTYAGIDTLVELVNFEALNGEAKLESWNLFGATYRTNNGEQFSITIGGEWELTLEVFRDLIIAMGVAMIVIYFVLVAQFKSFSDPLIIMSTIPLSVIGVFPGFMVLNYVQGEYFTATSMIGIIALAGIAVNNSILLLEYLNSIKEKQVSLVEALIESCAVRLRPIALTTVTTILGSMTILGDPVWAGLAWAIILGLAVSSSLILLVFPVLYYSVNINRFKA